MITKKQQKALNGVSMKWYLRDLSRKHVFNVVVLALAGKEMVSIKPLDEPEKLMKRVWFKKSKFTLSDLQKPSFCFAEIFKEKTIKNLIAWDKKCPCNLEKLTQKSSIGGYPSCAY